MRFFLIFSLFLLSTLTSWGQQNALSIEFRGMESRDGNVMLALRDARGNDVELVVVPIPANGPVVHRFASLPSGTYTVACYHDENSNEELDTNPLGIPTEVYGFSNDARGTFGPPDLEDQQFSVTQDKRITINMK